MKQVCAGKPSFMSHYPHICVKNQWPKPTGLSCFTQIRGKYFYLPQQTER